MLFPLLPATMHMKSHVHGHGRIAWEMIMNTHHDQQQLPDHGS